MSADNAPAISPRQARRSFGNRSLGVRGLAAWFGAYQVVHLVVNGAYMVGRGVEVFPAPAQGWTDQTVDWARGAAIVDVVIAAASIVFVAGFLRGRPWSTALGLVTTSVFTAAAVMFAISVVWIGAFEEAPAFYLFITLTAVPGALLLACLLTEVTRLVPPSVP